MVTLPVTLHGNSQLRTKGEWKLPSLCAVSSAASAGWKETTEHPLSTSHFWLKIPPLTVSLCPEWNAHCLVSCSPLCRTVLVWPHSHHYLNCRLPWDSGSVLGGKTLAPISAFSLLHNSGWAVPANSFFDVLMIIKVDDLGRWCGVDGQFPFALLRATLEHLHCWGRPLGTQPGPRGVHSQRSLNVVVQ